MKPSLVALANIGFTTAEDEQNLEIKFPVFKLFLYK
jgi:hypothetical protein